MEDTLKRKQHDWIEYHKMHARLRLSFLPSGRKAFLRAYRRSAYEALRRGGVGGMYYQEGDFFVKCLHLQAASYLAVGRHPAADWLEENVSPWECGDSLCSAESRRNMKI